jgi:hypothetical protein
MSNYDNKNAACAVVIAAAKLQLAMMHKASELEEQPALKRTRKTFVRPDYKDTAWGRMLLHERINDPTHRDGKRFQRRFGVTYKIFFEVSEAAKDWTLASEDGVVYWKADPGATDAFGKPTVPLNLKILGVFRMLSKGVAFDAISELAGLHESTMHAFFHPFIRKFNDVYKAKWISGPATAEEAEQDMAIYARLGMPGAANR